MRLDLSTLAGLAHLVALQITAQKPAVTLPARLELVRFKVQKYMRVGSEDANVSARNMRYLEYMHFRRVITFDRLGQESV